MISNINVKNNNIIKDMPYIIFWLSLFLIMITGSIFSMYKNECTDEKCIHINGDILSDVTQLSKYKFLHVIYMDEVCQEKNIVCADIYRHTNINEIKQINNDTIYIENDTIHIENDTIYTNDEIIQIENDIIQIKNNTIHTNNDTIYSQDNKKMKICITNCIKYKNRYRSTTLLVTYAEYMSITNKYKNKTCIHNVNNTSNTINKNNIANCYTINNYNIGINDNIEYACKIYETISSELLPVINNINRTMHLNIDTSTYLKNNLSMDNKCHYLSEERRHKNTEKLKNIRTPYYISLYIFAFTSFIAITCFIYEEHIQHLFAPKNQTIIIVDGESV